MRTTFFRRLGTGLALLSLCSLLGWHWAVLQSIAWARMLVKYSQENGVQSGVTMTFDGKHPCKMCCAIRKARVPKPEPNHAIAQPSPRLRLTASVREMIGECVPDPHPVRTYRATQTPSKRFRDEPPVPPPRASRA